LHAQLAQHRDVHRGAAEPEASDPPPLTDDLAQPWGSGGHAGHHATGARARRPGPPCRPRAVPGAPRVPSSVGRVGRARAESRRVERTLDEGALAATWLEQFERWQAEFAACSAHESTAMVLATAAPGGQPSARTVLLKAVDARGFEFFTNLDSRKGR